MSMITLILISGSLLLLLLEMEPLGYLISTYGVRVYPKRSPFKLLLLLLLLLSVRVQS